MAGLVAAAAAGAPRGLAVGLAVLVGLLLPPAGVIARARWSRLTGPGEQLAPALYLESAPRATALTGPGC
jgi:hypothetical protein